MSVEADFKMPLALSCPRFHVPEARCSADNNGLDRGKHYATLSLYDYRYATEDMGSTSRRSVFLYEGPLFQSPRDSTFATMTTHCAPPAVTQDTELVFIDSSPIRLANLPVPRVLKRKGTYFYASLFPNVPTLDIRSQAGLRGARNTQEKDNEI